jgi:hypothetical protein
VVVKARPVYAGKYLQAAVVPYCVSLLNSK